MKISELLVLLKEFQANTLASVWVDDDRGIIAKHAVGPNVETDGLYYMFARYQNLKKTVPDQNYYRMCNNFSDNLGEANNRAFYGACYNSNRHDRRAKWLRRMIIRELGLTAEESVV